MVVVGLLVLAVVALLSIWLANRLTRPIHVIERAAAQLATGDLSARADVPPTTDGELVARGCAERHGVASSSGARHRACLPPVDLHDLHSPHVDPWIRGGAARTGRSTTPTRTIASGRTIIGAEGRRLERLVRDLLDLARLDTHQFSMSPRSCDATEVVRDAAEAFEPQAHELGIELKVASGGVLAVDLDAERLGQIAANLVENALNYATSKVEVYAAPQTDGQIAIVVVDDGPGIPPDRMVHVFERLYTVRETPGRAVGTGLGLAIVRELAAAMGGRAGSKPRPAAVPDSSSPSRCRPTPRGLSHYASHGHTASRLDPYLRDDARRRGRARRGRMQQHVVAREPRSLDRSDALTTITATTSTTSTTAPATCARPHTAGQSAAVVHVPGREPHLSALRTGQVHRKRSCPSCSISTASIER